MRISIIISSMLIIYIVGYLLGLASGQLYSMGSDQVRDGGGGSTKKASFDYTRID